MKSFDEVIKAVECCADVTSCRKCPYYDKKKKFMGCMDKGLGKNIFLEDVLWYLRFYKAWKGDPVPAKE